MPMFDPESEDDSEVVSVKEVTEDPVIWKEVPGMVDELVIPDCKLAEPALLWVDSAVPCTMVDPLVITSKVTTLVSLSVWLSHTKMPSSI